MKFSCDKAVLSAAVSNVSRAVTTRTALQALEGILIRAEGDTLTLTGYDLELGITTVIPAAVSEEGSIILGARLFGEMIRKLEGGEVFVASDDKLLTEIRDLLRQRCQPETQVKEDAHDGTQQAP